MSPLFNFVICRPLRQATQALTNYTAQHRTTYFQCLFQSVANAEKEFRFYNQIISHLQRGSFVVYGVELQVGRMSAAPLQTPY